MKAYAFEGKEGEIHIRTVSPTIKTAKVNALYVNTRVLAFGSSDANIDKLFEERCSPFGEIIEVSVTKVETRTLEYNDMYYIKSKDWTVFSLSTKFKKGEQISIQGSVYTIAAVEKYYKMMNPMIPQWGVAIAGNLLNKHRRDS